MILNQQILKEFFVGLSTQYQAAYSELIKKDNDWTQVAMTIPSNTKENLYGWLSRWPKIRKWLGERHLKNLMLNGYRLTNEKFEDSIQIPRDDFDDDQIGMYSMVVKSGWSDAVVKFFCTKVFGLLSGGQTGLCFDGTPFFGANHPLTKSDGTTILQSNLIAGASPAWYLMDVSGMKPLIVQERRPFEFKAITDLNDSQVFMRDEFLFGIDARYAFGYGFWQRAICSQAVLSTASFDAAFAQMLALVDEEGEPIGVKPTLLVCGVSNRALAMQVIRAATIPYPAGVTTSGTNATGGNTNYNLNAVELVIVSWLP